MAPTCGTVMLSNGISLPYLEQGDPDGKAVLFLHGFAGSCHSFDQVLPLLPDSLYALVYSQRGHGDASKPQRGYRLQDFASDAREFLDLFGLQKAVVMKHGDEARGRRCCFTLRRSKRTELFAAFSL